MKQSEHEATEWLSLADLVEEAKRKPDEVEIQRRAGWALYGAGRYEDAKAFLEQAASRYPTDIEVQYALAMARKQAGDQQGALQTFRAVVERLEQSPDNTRHRMLSRLAQGHINMLEEGSWNLAELTWERR